MTPPEPLHRPGDPHRPPPGWSIFCRYFPGFAAGAFLGALLLALLLVFDVARLRSLLGTGASPHWSIFPIVPLLFGAVGAMIVPPAGKSTGR